MKGLSLEVRVGLLILLAVGLFGAFVVAIGGNPLERGYPIYVEFGNPGNLQNGAPVQIGSIRIGRVAGVNYTGGILDEQTGRRPMIVTTAEIDDRYRDHIYENAVFYVTSTSIVGESILAVDPGDPTREPLAAGSHVVGIDPPRMDLAFALAYELLQNISSLFRDHRGDIETLVVAAAQMLDQLNGVLTRHSDRIDHIIENIEHITDDANELVAEANQIIHKPEVDRIIRNVDHTLASVRRDIDPILADVRSATGKVDDLLDMVGPQQQEEIRTTIHEVSEMTEQVSATIADAQHIVSHIREGRGTVGAVLMDEELYDDIQEMVRDLKHNPWKLFWRE
jgi:phospholipid/cholesterol/gamma-HCH transport system substrate-binding protein